MKKIFFCIFLSFTLVSLPACSNKSVEINDNNVTEVYQSSKDNILNSNCIKTTTNVTTTTDIDGNSSDLNTSYEYQLEKTDSSYVADVKETFSYLDGNELTLNLYFDNGTVYADRTDSDVLSKTNISFEEFDYSYNFLQLPDLSNNDGVVSSTLDNVDDIYTYKVILSPSKMEHVYEAEMSTIENITGYSSDMLNPSFSNYTYIVNFNNKGEIIEVNTSYSIDISYPLIAELGYVDEGNDVKDEEVVHRTINTKTTIDDLKSVKINKPENLDSYIDINDMIDTSEINIDDILDDVDSKNE